MRNDGAVGNELDEVGSVGGAMEARGLEGDLPAAEGQVGEALADSGAAERVTTDGQDGRRYLGKFTVTYYCCEPYRHICGTGSGVTASGTKVTAGRSIGVDPQVIAYGTRVEIDGHEYVAEDTGGICGRHIDIAVETHEEALRLGRREQVEVWEVIK